MASRKKVVDLAQSWVGLKESDGSYKQIIDTYNSYSGKFPRGLKMKYGWAWCACTWSAIAVKLGYTNVMPIEISCQQLIEEARKKGIWVENDAYVPSPGDAVLYDWEDTGNGECTGWADHVGIVEEVDADAGLFDVIEGNKNNGVGRRQMRINGRYIRGFITPEYDDPVNVNNDPSDSPSSRVIAEQVIAGKWGSGDERKQKLEKAGYKYEEVQQYVNDILRNGAVLPEHTEIDQPVEKHVIAKEKAAYRRLDLCGTYKTTANLYCRSGAGTNKKALCQIPKGTNVSCYGYYSVEKGDKWYLILTVLDGVSYQGFCSSGYLKRVL